MVNYALGLFATLVLLVSWPRGKKGGKQKWTKITAQDMADPAYLEKLAEGNIGVILGPASGGIASIDCYGFNSHRISSQIGIVRI